MKKRTIGILATSVAVCALCIVTDASAIAGGGHGGPAAVDQVHRGTQGHDRGIGSVVGEAIDRQRGRRQAPFQRLQPRLEPGRLLADGAGRAGEQAAGPGEVECGKDDQQLQEDVKLAHRRKSRGGLIGAALKLRKAAEGGRGKASWGLPWGTS